METVQGGQRRLHDAGGSNAKRLGLGKTEKLEFKQLKKVISRGKGFELCGV